ncbi:neutral/alkaline non-lysosomal ceramidase N-terminal domain-containing protein [Limibacter armeniacum]|uniref:neutral/alkaline non-lysosomal ceramidase N-terminal domain-containing protein n=1 Tax=Limibacter armeniacum TaxID=466084 RepID=UPI002FE5F6D5
MKNFLIRFLKWISVFLLFLLVIAVAVIGKIDREPFKGSEAYQATFQAINETDFPNKISEAPLQAGWAKANIVPSEPHVMAGYGIRGEFESVHDSLYTRVFVLEQGTSKAVLVTLDLMIFPPAVVERLNEKLSEIGIDKDQVYCSATHTHNGYGGWDPSAVGQAMTGIFSEEVVEFIASQIFEAVTEANSQKDVAAISFGKEAAPDYVANRLVGEDGDRDVWLRYIKIQQEGGKTAILSSYSAHATCISKKKLTLSCDYPGDLIAELEQDDRVDFAAFCAGMVASHSPNYKQGENFDLTEKMGKGLSAIILSSIDSVKVIADAPLYACHIPINLGEAQFRLSQDLRLRDWVFGGIAGDLNADISVLRIGDILLLGMPCDFSGEISVNHHFDQKAEEHGLNLMVTSFNGYYVGYITADKYYDKVKRAEVREMNWVGPYKGAFFAEIVEQILSKFPNKPQA